MKHLHVALVNLTCWSDPTGVRPVRQTNLTDHLVEVLQGVIIGTMAVSPIVDVTC